MLSKYREGAKNWSNLSYKELKNTCSYDCSAGCSCKYLKNRTSYDRMQYDRFVQDDIVNNVFANSRY